MQGAELGTGLISGTVQHGAAEGETLGAYQALSIEAFRTAWRALWDTEPPPVAVAASILVGTTAELRDSYAAYDLERRTQGIAASRPKGVLQPAAPASYAPGGQISPVFHGAPDRVAKALLNDPASPPRTKS